jgi:hypothetical protein
MSGSKSAWLWPNGLAPSAGMAGRALCRYLAVGHDGTGRTGVGVSQPTSESQDAFGPASHSPQPLRPIPAWRQVLSHFALAL